MDTGNGKMGIAVTVPSCACCSARIEEEVVDALGLPRGSVKFVVPVTAQLVYDPRVVELGKIIESLKQQECAISVERVRYGIPRRPLFLPEIWKTKIERLRRQVPGVVYAEINFVRSVITVDYVPGLVRPHKVLNALLGERGRDVDSEKLVVDHDESIYTRSDNSDPAIIREHASAIFPAVGGSSRHCHNSHAEGMAGHV